MSQELVQAVQILTEEKGYAPEVIFEALEAALLQAYRRDPEANPSAYATVDRQTGAYHMYVVKTVVDEVVDPHEQITIADARLIDSKLSIGDMVTCDVTPQNFGRNAALLAKQMLIQRLREAERTSVFDEFSDFEGGIVSGVVSRIDGKNIYLNLGKAEALLPVAEQIPGEMYTIGKKVKAFLVEVKRLAKGPQLMVSRTHPGLLKRLFEFEVPEIMDGTVELKSVAREPGMRSKVSVYSLDPNVDPVGACVGPKGQRVQNIVDELCDEKIDIIKWDEDPAVYIAQSLSPAKVLSVEVHPTEKTSRVVVPDYQLSLAIGKAGQNARLAAKLTNWKIDIKSATQSEIMETEETV